MRLRLGAKIGAGFVVVLVLTVIVSVISAIEFEKINNSYSEVPIVLKRVLAAEQIKYNVAMQSATIRAYFAYHDIKFMDQCNQYGEENVRIEQQLIKEARYEENRRAGEEMLRLSTEYNNIIEDTARLFSQGKIAEGTAQAVDKGVPISKALTEKVTEYTVRREEEISKSSQTVADISDEAKNTVFIISILAFLCGIAVSYFVTRMITKPIKLLTNSAIITSKGDLTTRVQNIKGGDEIAELAAAVNEISEAMQQFMLKIKNNAARLAGHSEELMAVGEEASATIEEISGTAQGMAALSEESAAGAETAAEGAEYVKQAAYEGNGSVQDAVVKMGKIQEDTRDLLITIKELGNRSQQIGQVIEVISGIAGQTNLLALNAAIEAARAGEQGRGFAVVAEEVRKLAEQSAESAKQIAEIIGMIQNDMQKANHKMDLGAIEVEEGVKIANQAGGALNRIIELIEQSVESIKQIAEGAKQSSEGTHQLSSATQQVSSTVQQQAAAAQELARMADELHDMLSGFKL
jgi:methyl-accepting chemotaxis protein